MIKPKVLVALSGGVDSSIAALLLKEQGYDLVGVTFKVFDEKSKRRTSFDKGIGDAKILVNKVDIPYYIIDLTDDFEKQIISYFVEEYANGRTPNPCALCNYQIKWSKLVELADELGCDFVATGHYAKINHVENRYFISEANDSLKDQSFFLWRLNQPFLKRTLFPLGSLNKKEVKAFAKNNGLHLLAKKQESYNICFIPDGNYRRFLAGKLKNKTGQIRFSDGRIIGVHHGIWNYTLGQKKGIGLSKETNQCVIAIDAINNCLIVGEQKQLQKTEVTLNQLVFQKYDKIEKDMRLKAKISYRGELIDCVINSIASGQLTIRLNFPVDMLVPGQSVILFEGNDLVVGGVIIS